MSLYQGLLGAQVELAALPPSARLARAAAIAKLFATELGGTVALAPYAFRAATLHGTLPAPGGTSDDPCSSLSRHGVTLQRGVRYGSAPRAVADVYVPPPRSQPSCKSNPNPCVVFVHGGVWAAGEAFHYAPLGTSLARLGVVTYVITYTLYPDALVPALVAETAAALAFAMDDAPSRGGDPSRVALVGHSAGAHLAAMALLYKAAAAAGAKAGAAAARAAARAEASERQGGWGNGGEEEEGGGRAVGLAAAIAEAAAEAASANKAEKVEKEDDDDDDDDPPSTVDELLLHPAVRDPRMPALFVGCAGMYDAAKHYDFERARGVHELSTLRRAMGGAERFAAMSPSAILGAATVRAQAQARARGASAGSMSSSPPSSSSPLDATRFYETAVAAAAAANGGAPAPPPPPPPPTPWQLAGEAIAHRVGLDRESAGYAARDAQLAGELALAGMRDVLDFPAAAAAPLLPASVLMHAVGDATVPFDETTEMHRRLLDAGASRGSKVLLYRGKGVGHASFVLDWPASAKSKRWLARAESGGGWAAAAAAAEGSGGQGEEEEEEEEEDADADFWDLVAELPPHCRDLALVVTGRADIDFCKPGVESASASSAEVTAAVPAAAAAVASARA